MAAQVQYEFDYQKVHSLTDISRNKPIVAEVYTRYDCSLIFAADLNNAISPTQRNTVAAMILLYLWL